MEFQYERANESHGFTSRQGGNRWTSGGLTAVHPRLRAGAEIPAAGRPVHLLRGLPARVQEELPGVVGGAPLEEAAERSTSRSRLGSQYCSANCGGGWDRMGSFLVFVTTR